MYSITVAKLLLLLSVVCCLWSVLIVGRHVVILCQKDVRFLFLFVTGSFSVPYLVYSVRAYGSVIITVLKGKLLSRKKLNILKEHSYEAIILPSDLDIFNHMNNARYQRELDFARTQWYTDTGLFRHLRKTSFWIMVASAVRYRKSLEVFQRFSVKTKMIYWDEKHTYLEHRFIRPDSHGHNFIHAVILTKMRVLGHQTAEDCLREFLRTSSPPEKPAPSEELVFFMKYNDASSLSLRSLGPKD